MSLFTKKYIAKESVKLVLASFLLLSSMIFSWNSHAASGTSIGVGRIRSCAANGSVEGLDYNPTSGGKDVEFTLSNEHCVGVILGTYATVKAGISAMNGICGSGSAIPRIVPSPLQDARDVTAASFKAVNGNPACQGAVLTAGASLVAALAQLSFIYVTANTVYENTKVCGADWYGPNPQKYDNSAPNLKQRVANIINNRSVSGQTNLLTFEDKTYREWYYNGVEVEDNPQNGKVCRDPTRLKVGGEYPPQRYYMRGLPTGNFDCEKYNILPGQSILAPGTSEYVVPSQDLLNDLRDAYKCCKERSRNYICIDYGAAALVSNSITSTLSLGTAEEEDSIKFFCRAGEICDIVGGIRFQANSVDNGRLICAETYSLCPYNFSLSGGTEYCDYYKDGIWDSTSKRWRMITLQNIEEGNCESKSEIRNSDCTFNDKANKCRNYCQYLKHCTYAGSASYVYKSNIGSPYFSNACLNFVGDSQNRMSYNGLIIGRQRHFSAPIAQCMKETLENLFYNRAGHSKCAEVNEYPDENGVCPSGNYVKNGEFEYKQGNEVLTRSFFNVLQDRLQDIVRLVLVLSITFYGMNILILKNDIRNTKDIMMYLIKIGLVLYFATGNAWQAIFFEGVYNASSEISQIVFKIDTNTDELKRDGCQFGIQTLADGSTFDSGRNYPEGKEYLALWDTLDCKLMYYLGFGPQNSAANIASLIFASFFGPVGLYFALSVLFFAMMFLAATVRALHIFLSSTLSIIIMVLVSPVIIPMVLFEKTKGIFDKWVKEILGYILQPVILFAYISMMIIVIDRSFIGSATFVGTSPHKSISCAKYCKNSDGTIEPNNEDGSTPSCDRVGQRIINPLDSSVACLINFNDFGKFPGLEIFGITIPVLENLLEENVKQRVLTILKGALMMYLIYKFMDQISGIASNLVGGSALPSSNRNALDTLKKLAGGMNAIRQRIAGAGKQAAISAYNNRDNIKSAMGGMGNKGKSQADVGGTSGEDSVGSKASTTAGSDQAGSQSGSGSDAAGASGAGSGGADDSAQSSGNSGDGAGGR